MNEHLAGIKAIIFDLGNVIIELHYERSLAMLVSLTGKGEAELAEMLVTAPLLQQFEVGQLSEETFRTSFCEHMGIQLTSEQFDEIWNALLGEISNERIRRLQKVKESYKTFILSNTNSIHERSFNQNLKVNHGMETIDELVDRAYYSHRIGLRKPNKDIYLHLLAQEGLHPGETLFIDDRADNIEAAAQLGIHTFLNKKVDDWLSHPLLVKR
jgi:putative hydrolase of the HAD superfamily